jgi:hypothetical protein
VALNDPDALLCEPVRLELLQPPGRNPRPKAFLINHGTPFAWFFSKNHFAIRRNVLSFYLLDEWRHVKFLSRDGGFSG